MNWRARALVVDSQCVVVTSVVVVLQMREEALQVFWLKAVHNIVNVGLNETEKFHVNVAVRV